MKIRTDFVTNSSSSSFIISTNDDSILKDYTKVVLFDYEIKDKSGVNNYFYEEHAGRGIVGENSTHAKDNYMEELYLEMVEEIYRGNIILIAESVENYTDTHEEIRNYIYNNKEKLHVICEDEL